MYCLLYVNNDEAAIKLSRNKWDPCYVIENMIIHPAIFQNNTMHNGI